MSEQHECYRHTKGITGIAKLMINNYV